MVVAIGAIILMMMSVISVFARTMMRIIVSRVMMLVSRMMVLIAMTCRMRMVRGACVRRMRMAAVRSYMTWVASRVMLMMPLRMVLMRFSRCMPVAVVRRMTSVIR